MSIRLDTTQPSSGSSLSDPVTETHGGTAQTTYTKGDVLYASAANTLAKLPIGNNGQVLRTASTGIPAWDSQLSLRNVAYIYEDFISGPTGAYPWISYATGAGAGVAHAAHTLPTFGVWAFSTGTTNAGGAQIYHSASAQTTIASGAVMVLSFRIAHSAVSDGTDTYKSYVGAFDWSSGSPLTAPTRGFFASYTHSENGGKILLNVGQASSFTTVDSGITPGAGTYNVITIVSNSTMTSFQWYVDGVAVGSAVTTNIPTGAISIAPYIKKSAGTTSRSLSVDYIQWEFDYTTAR